MAPGLGGGRVADRLEKGRGRSTVVLRRCSPGRLPARWSSVLMRMGGSRTLPLAKYESRYVMWGWAGRYVGFKPSGLIVCCIAANGSLCRGVGSAGAMGGRLRP